MLTGSEQAVKILIAGPFSVGKTTLVGSVSEIKPLTTEEVMTSAGVGVDNTDHLDKTTTTVAMDFGRVSLSKRLVLYLFGAPGQPRFYPVLEDLSRGALGALVLADTRSLDKTYPILQLVEDLGLPYIVAVNTFDDAPAHDPGRLRHVMDLEAGTPLVMCDARDRRSSVTALTTLVEHLLTLTREPAR
ncbi:ATP/GTP-binding protein [Streptomyces sp. IB2014 016-6]|nr:ATP/GTP-binding protein [Streptomyces sp. IB2014 016-6]